MADPTWTLAFGPAAIAFLNGMQPGKVRRQIVEKAKSLQSGPHHPGCKKLQNFQANGEDVWRIRSGDYRILFVVRDQEVLIIDIDHRKDVYR